jgi:hypothetical protein
LGDPVQSRDRNPGAVGEDHVELSVRAQIHQDYAAANPDGRRRRLHRDRVVLLAEPAADEAEHPARQTCRQLPGPGSGVEDELVDDHVRVRPDGHRRLIDEQDLCLAVRLGADAFVEDDFLPDHQLSWRGTRIDAGRVRVDGAADADALLRDRRAHQRRAEQQVGQRHSA